MSYKILYSQLIGGKYYAQDDTIDFNEQTDRNYIARLETIGAIAKIEKAQKAEVKDEIKDESKPAPKTTIKGKK